MLPFSARGIKSISPAMWNKVMVALVSGTFPTATTEGQLPSICSQGKKSSKSVSKRAWGEGGTQPLATKTCCRDNCTLHLLRGTLMQAQGNKSQLMSNIWRGESWHWKKVSELPCLGLKTTMTTELRVRLLDSSEVFYSYSMQSLIKKNHPHSRLTMP